MTDLTPTQTHGKRVREILRAVPFFGRGDLERMAKLLEDAAWRRSQAERAEAVAAERELRQDAEKIAHRLHTDLDTAEEKARDLEQRLEAATAEHAEQNEHVASLITQLNEAALDNERLQAEVDRLKQQLDWHHAPENEAAPGVYVGDVPPVQPATSIATTTATGVNEPAPTPAAEPAPAKPASRARKPRTTAKES